MNRTLLTLAALVALWVASWLLGVNYPAIFRAYAGPCAQSSAPRISAGNGVISYCGLINAEGLNRLSALDLEAAERLDLTSAGGDGLLASIMAGHVRGSGVRVRAEGICASACATVWLRARHAEIGADGVVLVHATLGGRLQMIQASRTRAEPSDAILAAIRELPRIDPLSAPERRRIDLEATAAVGPICAGVLEGGELRLADADGTLAIETRHDLAAPDVETLTRWRAGSAPSVAGAYAAADRLRRAERGGLDPRQITAPGLQDVTERAAGFADSLRSRDISTC